jgi:hypothetical protein
MRSEPSECLQIIIQAKLIRMRPQRSRVHFVLLFVPDPGVDHVRVKTSPRSRNSWSFASASSASPSEPGSSGRWRVLPARGRRCLCRAVRRGGSCFARRRASAISSAANARYGFAARIGAAELDPLRLRARAVHRDAASRPSGCAASRRDSPALRSQGRAACSCWSSGRRTRSSAGAWARMPPIA